jgi:pSer/pThr/pTyr-binding forkhead associated (FHA) protein
VTRVYLEYRGDSVELPVGETSVGRDVGCTLRFNDGSVSRRHLRFVRRADDVFVEDLGSTNGTLLNGKKLGTPTRLVDGDIIKFGSREIAVRVGEAPLQQLPTNILRGENVDFDNLDLDKLRATTRIAVTTPPPALAPQRGQTSLQQRRHERHAIELKLVYLSSELEIEAMTRDLSEGGVFVCTQVLDPIGTTCKLTILIDGGPPLHLNGIVRRVVVGDARAGESAGLGVEFIELRAGEQAWLRTTVTRIAREGIEPPTELA